MGMKMKISHLNPKYKCFNIKINVLFDGQYNTGHLTDVTAYGVQAMYLKKKKV